jgi:DNA repair protein NreA
MNLRTHAWDHSPQSRIRDALNNARPMSRQVCLQCKGGRLLCGHSHCPLLAKIDLHDPVEERLKPDMFGPSTSVFVGWKDYPSVYVGPMTSLERSGSDVLDNPGAWYGLGFDDIVRMRSLMVRGKQKHAVLERSGFTEKMQELALSVRPVDVETHYSKAPRFSLSFSPTSQPMGASGELRSMDIVDNPIIPRKVDSVVSDELSATEQVAELFERRFDVYYLSNVLASGALGHEHAKKMVPTRWSITAVDDMLGKRLIEGLREKPEISDYLVFENTYLGNHFEILLMPGKWEFEQFEAWSANTLWTMAYDQPTIVEEHEPYEGRKEYAYNEGGGYYAGRFAVAEALTTMGRQARCIVFREIYDSYVMPVGVWEVRENVRKAMEKRPKKFNALKEALRDVSGRLTINIAKYMEKSQILRQRRLTDYM